MNIIQARISIICDIVVYAIYSKLELKENNNHNRKTQ